MMSETGLLPDSPARLAAATTFDRNVVVIAGAGTGKTTLLVSRLLHILLREPDPLPLSRVVALTFTNKAATEMKVRLRERLRGLLAPDSASTAPSGGAVTHAELRRMYGLTGEEISKRAEAALQDLERAQIGTLHSFASHLLRLYPIEAGVSPTFRTDEDGLAFEEHFAREWDLWLDRELGAGGTDHERWKELIKECGLDGVRQLAWALTSELVDVASLARQVGESALQPAMRTWIEERRGRAEALLREHDRPKRRKIELITAAVVELLDVLLDQGLPGLALVRTETREALQKDLGAPPTGWSEEEGAEVQALQRVAGRLLEVDPDLLPKLLAVVGPFVERVRRSFLEDGWLTFDGLLARARVLLRDHPEIRDRLKQEYRSLLVDEFQDTDPVQYEIVLYLCERLGRRASSWRETELEPGKLFIVGDPKQSIYAFRRADIEAFEHVVARLEREGALICTLATNFRSDAQVLDVVNGVFDTLLVAEANVQPGNVPLAVQPNRASRFHEPGVKLRLIAGGEDENELDSAAATRAEAEEIASLLARLLPAETRQGTSSSEQQLRPGQTALLFRKLTQADVYLQALRRRNIPYVIDGEKHFYRRQEIIDVVNLIRCLENPHDQIAFAGLLRSPLGGLSDPELAAVRRLDALDYRQGSRLARWEGPSAASLRRLYAILSDLHEGLGELPLPELFDRLFARLPILELAAASLHGEQAVANLLKLRQMAAEVADRPALSLSGFVELMMARLIEQPDEAESALSEETLDCVRVMTIHKAKGLEFPLVILAGLHHGDGASRGYAAPQIRHDWSTGIQGLEFGARCSLGSVLVAEKARIREQAERRRLLYVGMTRARECLVLSGAVGRKRSRGTFMDLLRQAFGEGFGEETAAHVKIGEARASQVVTPGREPEAGRQRDRPARLEAFPEGAVLAIRWAQRDRDWGACRARPLSVSPSRLMASRDRQAPSGPSAGIGTVGGPALGRSVHRALQYWDFAGDLEAQLSKLHVAEADEGDLRPVLSRDELELEVRELLRRFALSDFYARLRRADIVGREVPFRIPWKERSQVMEGVIDLVYRLDGRLWIADYKTDMIPLDQVAGRAEQYREQARVYSEAVSRSLREPVAGFEFVFLRHGVTVSVVP